MKTANWSRGEYRVAVRRLPDDGVRFGYVRAPFAIRQGNWGITHLPSGLLCCDRATTLREAKLIADSLLPLAHWEDPDPLRHITEAQRLAVRAVCTGR